MHAEPQWCLGVHPVSTHRSITLLPRYEQSQKDKLGLARLLVYICQKSYEKSSISWRRMDPWIVNDIMDQCLICPLEIWAWLTKCYLKIDISTINPLNVIHKNPHSHSSSHFLVSLPARFWRLKPFRLSSQMLTSPASHVSSLPITSLPPPWFTSPSTITRGWAIGLPNWRLFHHLGLQIEESFKIVNQLLELPSFQPFCASHELCPKNNQKPKQVFPVQLVTALQWHWPWGPLPNCPTSGDGACCSLRVAPPFHLISAQVSFPEYSVWGRPTLHLHFSSSHDQVLFCLCANLIDRSQCYCIQLLTALSLLSSGGQALGLVGSARAPVNGGREGSLLHAAHFKIPGRVDPLLSACLPKHKDYQGV